jgi:tetratricopeptide (TPR) repeat protein
MSHLEKINQLITELKISSISDSSNSFTAILELYPYLTKEEKKTVAESFITWAEQNALQQPLKLGYGKYLLCLLYFFYEDYEKSLKFSNEALKIFEEHNQTDAEALCASMLGSVYRPLGNFDLALKSFWEAYNQLKKSGAYQHNKMACSYHIASIYTDMGSFSEAFPLYIATLEQAEKLKNPIWIINSLHGLGKYYLSQKNYPEAKSALEKAKVEAEKLNNSLFTSSSLTDLANYYFELTNYTESEKLHAEALEIREQHKYTGGAVTNLIRIGEINNIQAKPNEAIAALNKGLELATGANLKPKMFQIHKLLSEIYTNKKEFEKSLFHYKQFHELHAQVETEDNDKKIKNVRLIFEAEQTKKENIIIKKQKQEIENKNIELQETIDELTRTKVGKKAKAFTLVIAIVLFLLEELILHFILHHIGEENFYLSFIVKMVIIFSLKPIDSAIEHQLLKKIIKKKAVEVVV